MPVNHQLNNVVSSANIIDVQEQAEKDFWFVYSCKNEKIGQYQKAFIRKDLYKSLTLTDRVSVDSGEITTDLELCTKTKKRIRDQLYYEENSETPALFTEQEIMRPNGPIEVREGKSFRAGSNIVVLTYAAKCRLKTNVKKNKTNIHKSTLPDHGTSSFSEDILQQIVHETFPHNLSNEEVIRNPSNDLWLAYSAKTITAPKRLQIYYIKKSVYEGLSIYDRISVQTGEITTDTDIQTKNKNQIKKHLYYEISSTSPALFTEEEIRKPGGPIEKKASTSYRRGTSTVVLTYEAKSQISSRLKSRFNQMHRDTNFAEKNFEKPHDANIANIETEKNPINDDIFSIPENILDQMLIENPMEELTKESVNFTKSVERKMATERDQIEMKNSPNEGKNYNPNNNNDDFSSTGLITANLDEFFLDSYWEQFRERDEEIVNVGIRDRYANSFKLFQPVDAELGRHNLALEESPNPKRHKSNS